jgi:hypothetical protein
MKMPRRSIITVDAPVREALSPKRPLGYTSVVSVIVKAASRICQGRAGPRAERSGEEWRDKRLKCRICRDPLIRFACWQTIWAAIRGNGSVTKTSIGGRDMIFRDGQCRSRKDHAPANFTPLKHIAHTLLPHVRAWNAACLRGRSPASASAMSLRVSAIP